MIFLLDDSLSFPDPSYGEEDGLFAIGGDLRPERLILAYSHGIFPWYPFKYSKEPYWYCPMKRFVIFPQKLHVSHSLKSLLKRGKYEVTFNQDFEGVISHCGKAGGRNEDENAWLGKNIIDAYTKLKYLGYASSVEVWENGKLCGGLYGVNIGRVFAGESMFSISPSASKVALVHLANKMMQEGLSVIDCQFETPHLKNMGGEYISYPDYMKFLTE